MTNNVVMLNPDYVDYIEERSGEPLSYLLGNKRFLRSSAVGKEESKAIVADFLKRELALYFRQDEEPEMEKQVQLNILLALFSFNKDICRTVREEIHDSLSNGTAVRRQRGIAFFENFSFFLEETGGLLSKKLEKVMELFLKEDLLRKAVEVSCAGGLSIPCGDDIRFGVSRVLRRFPNGNLLYPGLTPTFQETLHRGLNSLDDSTRKASLRAVWFFVENCPDRVNSPEFINQIRTSNAVRRDQGSELVSDIESALDECDPVAAVKKCEGRRERHLALANSAPERHTL